MNQEYKNQVRLLLNVLPEVAKEKCFALHGGTAINLFIRDMPRLSVDIDLTYLPIEDRQTTINNIAQALTRIKESIEKKIPGLSATLKMDIGKLLITAKEASIKLEVNLVGRGVIAEPATMMLCESAQRDYEVFCEIQVVPLSQLYGGKICAALDRQHPRDLFDVKHLLENEGFNEEIKKGFLYCLLGSERPINEILNPNLQDQKLALENQFDGMTLESFDYEEYEQVRTKLIDLIRNSLTEEDKEFLLRFKNLSPIWDKYNYADFPSVRWKLHNLEKLKERNSEKHNQLYLLLKELFKKKLYSN
ncbi:nucleotidyl transferase AbiEii/AbiGii toxin family protein [Solitalea lacus]|uniref:nucleotidyl transferase AbiEii/AbiGii toxin family protein n=1 Tax=Solitalea lacus TaxID=2911172 RepID=UPI001EDACF95|nr:nucleotidyl transferase AbiEii/AbiGii toxin family protein [Solitalea lacus]UKJ07153.1 nucleotidyl transferase AbiEii/AbiGii toxin family protein [Solitalea lacus]